MSGDKVIDAVLMARILHALVKAKANALEAYNTHLNKMGDHKRSKRDEDIEHQLKRDMDELEALVEIIFLI